MRHRYQTKWSIRVRCACSLTTNERRLICCQRFDHGILTGWNVPWKMFLACMRFIIYRIIFQWIETLYANGSGHCFILVFAIFDRSLFKRRLAVAHIKWIEQITVNWLEYIIKLTRSMSMFRWAIDRCSRHMDSITLIMHKFVVYVFRQFTHICQLLFVWFWFSLDNFFFYSRRYMMNDILCTKLLHSLHYFSVLQLKTDYTFARTRTTFYRQIDRRQRRREKKHNNQTGEKKCVIIFGFAGVYGLCVLLLYFFFKCRAIFSLRFTTSFLQQRPTQFTHAISKIFNAKSLTILGQCRIYRRTDKKKPTTTVWYT